MVSPITMFGLDFVFIIIWTYFLSDFMNYWAQNAIVMHSLVGIEAFLLNNINVFVFVFLIIVNIAGIFYTE